MRETMKRGRADNLGFKNETLFFLSLDAQRRAHDTQGTSFAMSSNATFGVETHARKRQRETCERDANAGEAIPRLPNHLVVEHILRTEYFDDPADLARLPAVSRGMRDAVAATGLAFEELGEYEAANLGCLSAVQRRQRRGLLSRQERLCQAAARSGQLEELQVLRADGCPWDFRTCWAAATGGHLEVLQWARANGASWDSRTVSVLVHANVERMDCRSVAERQHNTCSAAAGGGYLEMLQWARANGAPWDEKACAAAARGGHLEVLKWLRENGCLWDARTCSMAAGSGHLEVLQWARAKGCPWHKFTCSADTCSAAVEGGYFEVFQWARATAARGTQKRVRPRRRAEISRCCRGCARTAARGTSTLAQTRRWAGISRCCSGRTQTAARGTMSRARGRRTAGNSIFCSGCARTAVRGAQEIALWRRRAGNSRFCSMRARTVVRGTEKSASGREMGVTSSCWSGCSRTVAKTYRCNTVNEQSRRKETVLDRL